MKKFLLFLLLASAAHADRWYVNGVTYNGTIHRFNADRTQVYVTSDWDNYGGSWVKVANLDSATRVRLNVATPTEQASVKAANERAAAEAEERRRKEEQAAALAAAQRQAQIEEQRLAIERETLELVRRQAAQQRQTTVNNYYITPSRGYSGYGNYNRGYSPGVSVPHVPAVPHVPNVPSVPQVPHVPQPILLWYN